MSVLKQLNGHACCLLGLCCPPGSAEQRTVLVEVLGSEQAADWVQANVDLIPKGSGGQALLKAGFDMGVAHVKAKA